MILDWIISRLRRADWYGDPEETEKNMGTYDGGQSPVDSSAWKRSEATHRNGEPVPPSAPVQQTATGMQRMPTPDPYKDPNAPTIRNFGHQ